MMVSLDENGDFPVAPTPFNMAAHVLGRANQHRDDIALIVAGDHPQTLTYAELNHAVRATATKLLDHGLAAGDRVLMRLGNTLDFPIVYLAAIAVDLIPIPTSAALTAPEITHIAAETQPSLLVYEDGLTLPADETPRVHCSALRPDLATAHADFAMGNPNRPAYIIYTSGTSGRPMAVVHAHRAIWARQMMFDGWYGLRPSDRIFHAGAFNWTYTLGTGLMDPWAMGATAIVPADRTPASALPRILMEHKATIFAAAPGIYRRFLRADVPELPHLRHGLSAGEKLAARYRSEWETKTGTPVFEAFGMSECSTFISGCPDNPAPSGTSGFPQPGRKVALIGPEGPLGCDQPGVIAIHKSDPGLMLGYLNAPAQTAARYQGDWFLTGDIGKIDAAGAITYAGRADDMMNAGGIRVSPVEVEDALIAHPSITEAAACAVQVRTETSVIAAFYVATDMIDEDQLRDFMAGRLADYKTPRLYIARDTLPRGANNKLLRRLLRQEWETANGQA